MLHHACIASKHVNRIIPGPSGPIQQGTGEAGKRGVQLGPTQPSSAAEAQIAAIRLLSPRKHAWGKCISCTGGMGSRHPSLRPSSPGFYHSDGHAPPGPHGHLLATRTDKQLQRLNSFPLTTWPCVTRGNQQRSTEPGGAVRMQVHAEKNAHGRGLHTVHAKVQTACHATRKLSMLSRLAMRVQAQSLRRCGLCSVPCDIFHLT